MGKNLVKNKQSDLVKWTKVCTDPSSRKLVSTRLWKEAQFAINAIKMGGGADWGEFCEKQKAKYFSLNYQIMSYIIVIKFSHHIWQEVVFYQTLKLT